MADDPLSITFAALADPTRRAILARLADGEATVNELAEPFDISLQAVSKHLKVLERAGLITRGQNAQYRPCRLEAGAAGRRRRVDRATPPRSGTDRFDRLEQHLRDIQQPQPPTHPTTRQGDTAMSDTSTNLGEVTYTRVYDAPRELVFRCMIEPEHLTHFWGPVGVTTPIENITDRSAARRRLRDDHGERRQRRGVPDARASSSRSSSPRSIVWSEPDVEGGMTTSITFTDLGDGKTEVVVHQTNVPEMYRTPEAQAGHAEQLRPVLGLPRHPVTARRGSSAPVDGPRSVVTARDHLGVSAWPASFVTT